MFFFDPCPHISVQAIKNRGMGEWMNFIMMKNIKGIYTMLDRHRKSEGYTIPWKNHRRKKRNVPVLGY